ncbi:MAG: cadherin-like domain-containing protein [Campylobacterales bacterium]|nr:cadherin-like domain-containing protein [Campylobacterales bacterium]
MLKMTVNGKVVEGSKVVIQNGDKIIITDMSTGQSPIKMITKHVNKSLQIFEEGVAEPSLVLDDYYAQGVSAQLSGIDASGGYVDYSVASDTGSMELLTTEPVVAASTTATAASTGLSTMEMAGIGLGVIAVGGGIALAAGGGGSDTKDTVAPAAPTLVLATDSGASTTDGITNVATVNVAGLESGATWQYSSDNGVTWITGTGTSFTATSGEHTYLVRQTDTAGNVSTISTAVNITVDTTAPTPVSMSASGTTVSVVFSEAMDTLHLPSNAFEILVNNVSSAVSGISVTGNTVTLTLASALSTGDSVQIRYSDPTVSVDDINAVQDSAGNDAASFLSGIVADGYVRSAEVWVDVDGDGNVNPDKDYFVGLTNSDGNYFIPDSAPSGTIIAMGGVNIDSGIPNTMVLKAPEGSSVINPLTTLVEATIQDSKTTSTPLTVAEASAKVVTALGLTTGTDLTTYDPLIAVNSSDPTEKANAVASQKAAATIATIITLAANASADATAATNTIISNMVTEIKTSTIDLTNTTVMMSGVAVDSAVTAEIDSASTAIASALTITAITTAQSEALDTIAPGASTLTAATATNDITPTVHVNLDVTSTNGKAVVAGDTVILKADGVQVGTTTLTAANIVAGYVNINTSDLSDGSHSLSGVVVDHAGNSGDSYPVKNITIDTSVPIATITMSDTALTIGETSTVTVKFSEAVTGFSNADVTVANGTLSTLASTDNITWTGTFTPTANITDATNLIRLANSYTDSVGNPGTVATSGNYTINTTTINVDMIAPTATITMSDTALKMGETSMVTVTFSEAVTGFSNDDVTVANGTLGTLTSTDNITWTATFTPAANVEDTTNVVTLASTYTDITGNIGATESSVNYTIDTKAPVFSSSEIATAINENSGVNQVVYTAMADDISVITYALKPLSGDVALFTIDSATGAVTLIDNPDYETKSNYSFTVIATDTEGNASEQVVSLAINNINEAPTVSAPIILTDVAEDSGAITITAEQLLANANDINGDILTVANLSATSGILVDNMDGTWSLTPDANYNGEITLNYDVTDGMETVATTATQVVIAVNDAPTVSEQISNVGLIQNDSFVLDTSNKFEDIDSNTLTYSVTGLPTGLTLDPITGVISGSVNDQSVAVFDLGLFEPSSTEGSALKMVVKTTEANQTVEINWQFLSGDYMPYNDFAFMVIDNGIVKKIASVESTGSNHDIGTFISGEAHVESVIFEEAGMHTIVFGMLDYADGVWTSAIDITGLSITPEYVNTIGEVTSTESGWRLQTNGASRDDISQFVGGVGVHTVTVTATDEDGNNVSQTFTILISNTNEAPTSSSIETQHVNENSPFVLDTSLAFQDIDSGDVLIYSASGIPAGFSIDAVTGVISGTPTNSEVGDYTVIVTATDLFGLSASSSFTLNVINVNNAPVVSAPVALTDVLEDSGSILITAEQLLANASDIDGDTLSVANLSASAGTLVDNMDGTWSLTPDTNYTGEITLSYEVSDGTEMVAASALQMVTSGNHAPEYIGTGSVLNGFEDTPMVVVTEAMLLDNFVDIDGDSLSIANLSVSSGTLTENSGSWTYTPEANYSGAVTLSYTVSDGVEMVSHNLDMNIAPVDDHPVSSDADVIVAEDTTVTGALPPLFDIEGDGAVYVKGIDPAHGVVTVMEDGSFTYTPNEDYNGPDNFTFTVTETTGAISNKLDYVFVMDDTGSMGGTIDSVKTNVSNFVSQLVASGIDAQFGFVRYGENSEGAATFSGFYNATTVDDFQTALGTVYAHGGADAPESGLEALMLVQDETQVGFRSDALKHVVVLTDITFKDAATGFDYYSGPALYTMDQVITELRNDGIIVDVAGTTSDYPDDAGQLPSIQYAQITGATGGTVSDVYDPTFYSEGFNVFSHYYTVSVDVTPVNDAPAVSAPVALTDIAANSSLVLITAEQLLANASDVDGDTLTVANLSASAGTLVDNMDGTWSLTPDTNYTGEITLSYEVSDGTEMVAASALQMVTSVTFVDIAEDSGSVLITAEQLLANASNVNGDTLTVVNLSASAGTLVDNMDGTWILRPDTNYNGEITLSYEISDGIELVAVTAIQMVTPVNDAPVVSAPIALVDIEKNSGSVLITAEQLLANASDVDGDALSVANLSASAGTLVDNMDGTWSLTPDTNYTGEITLSYEVSDGTEMVAASAIQMVISIVISAPVILTDVAEDSGSILITVEQLLANASDINGDILTVANLTTTAGTLVDNMNGTWSLTPDTNYNGEILLNYSVSDGMQVVDTSALQLVTPVNDAPVVSAPVVLADLVENSGSVLITAEQLLANASDVEGDTLIVANLSASAGTLVDNMDGTWSLTPDTNYTGEITLSYEVSDGTEMVAASALQVVTSIVIGAPVILTDVAEDSGSILITAEQLLANASDVNGDPLTVTNLSTTAGTLVDNMDGTWSLIPDTNYNGEMLLNYSVSDGTQVVATSALQVVTPVNDAPVFGSSNDAVNILENGTGAVYQADASDVDGDTLSYTLSGTDAEDFNINAQTGAISFKFIPDYETPKDANSDNQYDIVVQAVDQQVAVAEQTVSIGVDDVLEGAIYAVSVGTVNVSVASGNSLINTLGGSSGFGNDYLYRNDDGSTGLVDITSVFPDGVTIGDHTYTSFYINNNGNVTFASSQYTYTPYVITGTTSNPIIAPFFADVDTRGGVVTPTEGGTSTGSNLVWWSMSPDQSAIYITWDDVGYYGSHTDKLNAFQLVIYNTGNSSMAMEMRYEDMNWVTGDASGGSYGLGGTVARAGWSLGDGVHYAELSQSGVQDQMLSLEAQSNINHAGVFLFSVNEGAVSSYLTALLPEGGNVGISSSTLTVIDGQHPADDIIFTVTAIPQHGTLLLQTTGGVVNMSIGDTFMQSDINAGYLTYQHDGSENFTDNFSYHVENAIESLNDTFTFNITPVNYAPVITAPIILNAVAEDSGSILITAEHLLANASDADGDTLTVANLTATAGTLVDNMNGTWSLTADANYNGEITLSYGVTDGIETVATSALQMVTPVNDAPVVSASVIFTEVAEDGSLALITTEKLLENASDADGDTLTVANLSASAGTLVDNMDGTWSFTPDAGYTGEITLSYDISDGIESVATTAIIDYTHLLTIIDGTTGDDVLYSSSVVTVIMNGKEGNDSLSVDNSKTVTLDGGVGNDTLNASFYNGGYTQTGDTSINYQLNGGTEDDTLNANGYAYSGYGMVNLALDGGIGNDTLTVSENYSSWYYNYGAIKQATLSGGDGDDRLTASGVLELTLSGGAGSDTFALTTTQVHTQLASLQFSTQVATEANGWDSGLVTVDGRAMEITDFTAGVGGDVLDINDLLLNGSTGFDGTNPFASGYLSFVQSGADTLVQFDADGSAGSANTLSTIATLKNTTATEVTSDNFAPNYPLDGSAIAGESIVGTDNNDNIVGTYGADTITGLAGNDTIDGSYGNDTIDGGDGSDSITGNLGNDTMYGGAGDDYIYDNQDASSMDGGEGNDTLQAYAANSNQTLLGGVGSDYLYAQGQSILLNGGDDNDYLAASGSVEGTLLGGSGDDSLQTDSVVTVIMNGEEGNDSLYVNNSKTATLDGGAGADMVNAYFNNGSFMNTGDTSINYQLNGGTEDDTLNANGYAYSGYGMVKLALDGGIGNDTLTVSENYSSWYYNYGAIKQATLSGGEGDDRLTASGVLELTLNGGTGSDTFALTTTQVHTQLASLQFSTQVATEANGWDSGLVTVDGRAMEITDFTVGVGGDVLDINDLLLNGSTGFDGTNPFASGHLSLVQSGADTLVQFDADGSAGSANTLSTIATLKNVEATQIVENNFDQLYTNITPAVL